MEPLDYGRRFHAAVTKAFASSDVGVRMAYFDLANFYRQKLDGACGLYPPADLLRDVADMPL